MKSWSQVTNFVCGCVWMFKYSAQNTSSSSLSLLPQRQKDQKRREYLEKDGRESNTNVCRQIPRAPSARRWGWHWEGKHKDQTLTLAKRNSGTEWGWGTYRNLCNIYREESKRRSKGFIYSSLQLNYLFSHLGTVFSALDIKINETDLYPLKLPSKYLI